MLQAIVRFSLRYRGVGLVLAGILLAYGAYVAGRAKLDVLPDFVPPEVVVQTEAPGLAPEQVETLVTRPLENALNGLGHLAALRSETIQGLSVITVVFEDGTEILPARQTVAEKLTEAAGQLPAGVQEPKMEPLTSATMDLLKIGLLSDKLSPMELRTFADWKLKPRLLSVPGVAKCSVFGGEVRQLQIQVHPQALVARGLSLDDVLNAARLSGGVFGAGFVDTPNQRVLIQSEGQSATPERLGLVAIARAPDGGVVRIRDVATVAEGAAPRFGDALIMGRPGVLMTMSSQYGANTRDATAALEAALDEMKPLVASEGIVLYPRLHRPATFIEASLANIRHSLLLGAALVAVVLFAFLRRVRTALISLVAIPLSLLGSIVMLDRLGVSINTITLGGLAIALGEVVDDAIIDVENIVRRLRENRALPAPRPAAEVILRASLEVRSAVVYATFVVALVFAPVLALTGLQGAFFAPLAKAYVLAILTSLLVALTVTPALTLALFARDRKEERIPRLQLVLRRGYERVLRGVMGHRALVVGAVAVLCVLALLRLRSLGGEFLPEFREGHFVIAASAAPGTSLDETRRIGEQVSRALLADPHVATVEEQIGRAEQGEDTWGPHQSEFHVELKPLSDREAAGADDEVRGIMSGVPGLSFDVGTFVTDRIGESISGETAPVVVNVFGDDLDALDVEAAQVAAALATVPGATDVQQKAPPGAPGMTVRLRPERLARYGLRPSEALQAVQAAYQGAVANQVYLEDRVEDVAVVLDPASRRDPRALGGLLLAAPSGGLVRLDAVADIFLGQTRSSISHDGARRRQTVTCSVTGRDVQSFVAEARGVLARKVALPRGMYLEFSGAAEAQAAATRQLLVNAAVASVGILLLLSVVLGHWRNLLIVFANLPFALAGGVVGLSVSAALGGPDTLSMGALVGFVTLFGIATRNAIMLMSHFEHLLREEGGAWDLETAVRGASERLVPILMTATVTSLGLLPLALGSGEAGREIEGPMAVVILGGLVTSTVLNLLVLPPLALRWARWEKARE